MTIRISCRNLIAIALTLVVMPSISFLAQEKSLQILSIRRNGYFRVEHGHFSVSRETIQAFSVLPRAYNEDSGKKEPIVPEDRETRTDWKGESYFRDTYIFRAGEWIWNARDFSDGVERITLTGPCDSADQLDSSVRYPSIVRALGEGSQTKLKDVSRVVYQVSNQPTSDRRATYAFVVYTNGRDPHFSLGGYFITVAVLREIDGEWKLHARSRLGEPHVLGGDAEPAGDYCGSDVWPVESRGEGLSWNILIRTNEHAASSNYYALHSFIIMARPE